MSQAKTQDLKVSVTFWETPDIVQEVDVIGERLGISRSGILRMALREYLKKEAKNS